MGLDDQRSDVFLSDVFRNADPQLAGFMARHNALLERVTVLERALEWIASEADDCLTIGGARRIAKKALNG